jgi:hypothetical protein
MPVRRRNLGTRLVFAVEDTDTPTPTVSGQVYNPGGAVTGLTVTVSLDDVASGTTTTDSSGHFTYTFSDGLANDTYEIAVSVPAVVASTQTIAVSAPPAAPTDIRIDMDWAVEGQAEDTPLGKFFVIDPSVPDDACTITLTDTAGSRFKVDADGQLRQGATALSYASAPILSNGYSRGHSVTVLVTETVSGLTFSKTINIRVFPDYDTWRGTTPAAAAPSTFSGLVLDIDPAGTVSKDGSNNVASITSTEGFVFSQATGANKPLWVATAGPQNKPVLRLSATQYLDCATAGLVSMFDAAWEMPTVIIIASTSTVDATARAAFGWRAPTTAGNSAGYRLQSRFQNAKFYQYVGDSTGLGNAALASTYAVDTVCCFMSMVASAENLFVERDFRGDSRLSAIVRNLTFDAYAANNVRIGGSSGGMVGDIYRILVFNRRLTLTERFQIYSWASATYGSAAPSWAKDIDLSTGYTLTYDDDFDYAALTDVQWAQRNAVPTAGFPDILPGGWGAAPTNPNNTAYGGTTNNLEDAFFLDVSRPAYQGYGVLEFRNSLALQTTRDTPAELRSIATQNGLARPFISSILMSRYGGHQGIYGVWTFRGTMPFEGGQGVWPAYWTYSVALDTGEWDLQEWFGQDPFGVRVTVHDTSLTGGQSQIPIAFDDFREGLHEYTMEITPTQIKFYVDYFLVHSLSTTPKSHQSKFTMLQNTVGNAPSSFSGDWDETTVFPNTLVTEHFKFYEPTVPVTALGGTQTETTALVSAMTSAGSTPDAGRQTAINTAIAKMKGTSAPCPDGTSRSVWAVFDGLVIPAAHSEAAGFIDWKDPSKVCTKVGTPGFTADRGVKSTGAGNYWDTGVNLTTVVGYDMTANDCHWSVFTLDESAGASDSHALGTSNWRVSPGPATPTVRYGLTSDADVFLGSDTPGLYTFAKKSSYGFVYKDGDLTSGGFFGSVITTSSSFDNETIKIGAATASAAGTQRIAVAGWGRVPSPAHARALNTIMREYLTTLGAI